MSARYRVPTWHRKMIAGFAAVAAVAAVAYLVATSNPTSTVRPRPPERSFPAEENVEGTVPVIPRTLSAADDPRITELIRRVDPANDAGWDTETYARYAQIQLDRLANVLADSGMITPEHVSEIASDSATCSPLRPVELTEAFADGSIVVRRKGSRDAARVRRVADEYHGPDGLAEAIQEMLVPLGGATEIHVKFKIVRVQPRQDWFETVVYVQSSGRVDRNRVQQNAVWTCRWKIVVEARIALLSGIELNEYEEVLAVNSRGIRFVDQTDDVLGKTRSYRGQMLRGVDHWRRRLERNFGVDPNGNQGIAIGDANGDGLDDIYVCQQGGLPNRLYIRDPDGTLRDESSNAGVDWMELTRSALFLDLDNDGDQDLAICQGWYLLIMLNDGAGRFQLEHQLRCRGDAYSMAAADYDNDADVDIFLCGRNPNPNNEESMGILGSPLPYHDANNGAPNMLWENDGKGRFRDVTKTAGLDQNNRRFSYAAAWADYDNDGDMDLYVANDFGRNNLYRNDGGRMVDVAASSRVEDISAGMGATWGDYDNDGLLDLYVCNMFSSAGNRIAYQRQFRAGSSENSLGEFRRHARGNTLFRNADQGRFQDVSQASGVTMGRWAWGAKFVDLNNDSLEDLYVANGFITTEDSGDL